MGLSKKELLKEFKEEGESSMYSLLNIQEDDLQGCCALMVYYYFDTVNYDHIQECFDVFCDEQHEKNYKLTKKEIEDFLYVYLKEEILTDKQYIITLNKNEQALSLKIIKRISRLPENRGQFKFIDFKGNTGNQLVLISKTSNIYVKK